MKRLLALLAFSALLWQGGFTANNPPPSDARTFEASRTGFEPVQRPGKLERDDFVRLILRREGEFRIPLTVNFRDWRRAQAPVLWDLELPHVVKVEVGRNAEGLRVEPHVPKLDLRLAAGATFNLPLIVRNRIDEPTDLHVWTQLGEAASAARVTLDPGDNYVVVNIRPERIASKAVVELGFSDGTVDEEGRRVLQLQAEVASTGKLHLRTLEGGVPVEARVYLTGSDGLAYGPPSGSLSKITWTAGDYFFYSAGDHTIEMPVGEARVEVVRGFEYEPVVRTVRIEPGQTATLTANLERFSHVAEDGWWGGDVHIHANYNDHEFITPAEVLLQSSGEDLNVANPVVANSTGTQIHDQQYFSGKPHAVSRPRHLVRWTEEMRNTGLYGHMCLPGVGELVEPFYTGFQGTPHPYHYPPNYNQAVAAQQVGGVASYAHPGYSFTDDPSTMSARELPVDLALGAVEAMDVLANSNEEAAVPMWYALLNTGLRCAISGGSDSFTNRRHHWLAGGQRVYVQSGPDLNYEQWIEAYRRGRSFASNGPLMRFSVDGEPAGSELERSARDRVAVEVLAESLVEMSKLEIVVNGAVVAAADGPSRRLRLSHTVELSEGCWIAARVDGEFHRYVVNDSRLFAHTSPVYVNVDRKGPASVEDARFFMRWIDKLTASVEERGRFERPEHLAEVKTLFAKARGYYEGVAGE